MNFDRAIRHIYPNAVNGVDFSLQDDSDGKGVYIKEWLLGDVVPSKSELEIAESDAIAVEEKEISNKAAIEGLKEIDFKSIRALREGNNIRLGQLEAEAVNLRKQLS